MSFLSTGSSFLCCRTAGTWFTVHSGRTLRWYLLVVMCTSTAGLKLLLDSEYFSSSGWVKMHRHCTANGSSRLDSAESFLVYTANLLAVQFCRQVARPTLLAANHEASSSADYSGCLCFLCKSIHCSFSLAAANTIRHSKADSISTSTATLSPVQQQRGFGQLSTINENVSRTGDALSASTESMIEKDSPTKPPHSWLTNFLVDAHLSAPNRRMEAN